jgi:hypothetical protein
MSCLASYPNSFPCHTCANSAPGSPAQETQPPRPAFTYPPPFQSLAASLHAEYPPPSFVFNHLQFTRHSVSGPLPCPEPRRVQGHLGGRMRSLLSTFNCRLFTPMGNSHEGSTAYSAEFFSRGSRPHSVPNASECDYSPLATRHSPLPSITTFKINTCISVENKRLYPPLESTHTKKQGRGEGVPIPVPSFLSVLCASALKAFSPPLNKSSGACVTLSAPTPLPAGRIS